MSYHYEDRHQQVINEALAILESRQRHLGQAFTHPRAAADFLRLKMGEYEREVFALLLLDNQHRLLDYQELFFGTINAGSVYLHIPADHEHQFRFNVNTISGPM